MIPPTRLLVVENDEDLSTILREYFTLKGYFVINAIDGPQALTLFDTEHPDLILMDIGLGQMSGFEVFRRMRKSDAANVPIIFMTGKHDKGVLMEGLQLGADDFVFKPFDPQELLLRIENALERTNRQRHANPYTGLPNAKASTSALAAARQQPNRQVMVVWVESLDTLGPTGTLARARLLRAVGQWLTEALDEVGEPDDFLGHQSTDYFLIICDPAYSDALYEKARALFEANLPDYYPIDASVSEPVPLFLRSAIK